MDDNKDKDKVHELRNLQIPADSPAIEQAAQVAGEYIARQDASVPKHIREVEEVAEKAWKKSIRNPSETVLENPPTSERKEMQELYQQLRVLRKSFMDLLQAYGVDNSNLEERYFQPKGFPGGVRMKFTVGGKGENEIKVWWQDVNDIRTKERIFSIKENGISKYSVEVGQYPSRRVTLEDQHGEVGKDKNSEVNTDLVINETKNLISALDSALKG